MKMFSTSLAALVAAATFSLSGCADVPTTQVTQQNSPDQNLTAYFVNVVTSQGVNAFGLLVWDNRLGAYVLQMAGQELTLGRELVTNLLSPGVLASLISGQAAIQIARDGTCDGLCGGTVIYNDGTAVAGAVSNSESEANSNSGASVDMSGGSGYETHISSSNFDPTLSLPLEQAVPFLMSMHNLDKDQAEWVYVTTIGLRAQLEAM